MEEATTNRAGVAAKKILRKGAHKHLYKARLVGALFHLKMARKESFQSGPALLRFPAAGLIYHPHIQNYRT